MDFPNFDKSNLSQLLFHIFAINYFSRFPVSYIQYPGSSSPYAQSPGFCPSDLSHFNRCRGNTSFEQIWSLPTDLSKVEQDRSVHGLGFKQIVSVLQQHLPSWPICCEIWIKLLFKVRRHVLPASQDRTPREQACVHTATDKSLEKFCFVKLVTTVGPHDLYQFVVI